MPIHSLSPLPPPNTPLHDYALINHLLLLIEDIAFQCSLTICEIDADFPGMGALTRRQLAFAMARDGITGLIAYAIPAPA